jgi:hypothetical protein
MSGLEAVEEAIVAVGLLVSLGLGLLGLFVDRRRRDGAEAEERWAEQERRLENEEDTRDEGPI